MQEISEKDAIAEGFAVDPDTCHVIGTYDGTTDPICAFADLWASINGPGSWDANPWVWVVEFKKLEAGK